jgi:hypothetical protein
VLSAPVLFLCLGIGLGGGLLFSGILCGWPHTKGAIARPGVDSFSFLLFVREDKGTGEARRNTK